MIVLLYYQKQLFYYFIIKYKIIVFCIVNLITIQCKYIYISKNRGGAIYIFPPYIFSGGVKYILPPPIFVHGGRPPPLPPIFRRP